MITRFQGGCYTASLLGGLHVEGIKVWQGDFGKGNASMVCLVMEEGLRVEGIETFQAFSGKPNFDYTTIRTHHMFRGMDLHPPYINT